MKTNLLSFYLTYLEAIFVSCIPLNNLIIEFETIQKVRLLLVIDVVLLASAVPLHVVSVRMRAPAAPLAAVSAAARVGLACFTCLIFNKMIISLEGLFHTLF